jgi:hypothetical protein
MGHDIEAWVRFGKDVYDMGCGMMTCTIQYERCIYDNVYEYTTMLILIEIPHGERWRRV